MPELPEVETTRRGIAPAVTNRVLERAIVRERRLRWHVPPAFAASVAGQQVLDVRRRAT